MSLQELCRSLHLHRREATPILRNRCCQTAISADKMTVQCMQNMVHKNLRSVMRLLQRGDKSLTEVMDDRVEYPIRPDQLLHSWRSVSISNLIQSSLCDIKS